MGDAQEMAEDHMDTFKRRRVDENPFTGCRLKTPQSDDLAPCPEDYRTSNASVDAIDLTLETFDSPYTVEESVSDDDALDEFVMQEFEAAIHASSVMSKSLD